jgi:hypothetical protein
MRRRAIIAACAAVVAAGFSSAVSKAHDGCTTKACEHRVAVKLKHRAYARMHGGCSTHGCVLRVRRKHFARERRKLSPATLGMLRRLRGCETRGLRFPLNYRYRGAHDGAYQYLPDTWHRAGGEGRANEASPAEQDVRTARFYPSHRSEWACRA